MVKRVTDRKKKGKDAETAIGRIIQTENPEG